MKVFFDASLSGKREYEENYRLIADAIERMGHERIESTLFTRSPKEVAKETATEATGWYRRLKSWIAKCDLAIFEVSHPSTGVGHEVSLSLSSGKPVITLHVKGRHPFVLETIPSERLQVIEYSKDDAPGLMQNLSATIKYASEQMDTRFNFFIPRRLVVYLDWISKKRRIPRAVYLRQLLRAEMQRNKDYES